MPPAVIEIEPPPVRTQDEEAVAAVRQGDAERYRELVERYQRQVYAVAWSRLGDATLAEEATQEAFIRAYRSLPLLATGRNFPRGSVPLHVTSPSAKTVGGGVGVGATIMAALGKVLPFKFIAVFVPMIAMLPGFGMAWWMGRSEQRNFRDQEGFRARLYRDSFKTRMWFMGAAVFLFIFIFVRLGMDILGDALSLQTMLLAFGLFGLVMIVFQARAMTINRSRFQVAMFLNGLITTSAALAVGLGWLPMIMFNLAIVVGGLVLIPAMSSRPVRMDYNLFLRAKQGLLKNPTEDELKAGPAFPLGRGELLAYSRFLGGRFLALNFRWAESGLQLCLPAFKRQQFAQIAEVFSHRWEKSSWIQLGWDGVVSAHCGSRDEAALPAVGGNGATKVPELETQVAAAVQSAWNRFRAGDVTAAERLVGQVPDAEVFVEPPARAVSFRVWGLFMLALALVMIFLAIKEMPYNRTRPLRDQLSKLEQQRQQKDTTEYILLKQNSARGRQIADLERQAINQPLDEAQALHDQVEQLKVLGREADEKVKQTEDELVRMDADIYRLEVEIAQIMNQPPPKPLHRIPFTPTSW